MKVTQWLTKITNFVCLNCDGFRTLFLYTIIYQCINVFRSCYTDRIVNISLKDPLLFMIRDLTIINRNVKHLESSDAAVSQFLIRYLAVWPGP